MSLASNDLIIYTCWDWHKLAGSPKYVQNMYIRRVQWSQRTFCCIEKRTSGTPWDNQIEHQFIVWNIDMTHSKKTVWTWKFWPNADNSPSWTVKPPEPARLWWQKQVFVSLRRSWIQTKYTAKFGRTLHCIMPIPLGGFQIFREGTPVHLSIDEFIIRLWLYTSKLCSIIYNIY